MFKKKESMKKNKLAIFFLGPPGAGKGTQAKLLAKKLGVTHISTGDVVRENIKSNPEAKAIYDKGRIIPDSLVLDWMRKRLDKINSNIVIDGMPRTVAQAEGFLTYFVQRDYKLKIFNIDISPKESIKRNLKRARGIQDQEEKIKERLCLYDKVEKPALEFLGNKVIQINGEQSIENVHKDICNAGGWKDFSADNGSACASCEAQCPLARTK